MFGSELNNKRKLSTISAKDQIEAIINQTIHLRLKWDELFEAFKPLSIFKRQMKLISNCLLALYSST
jgi:hypothetical protein